MLVYWALDAFVSTSGRHGDRPGAVLSYTTVAINTVMSSELGHVTAERTRDCG